MCSAAPGFPPSVLAPLSSSQAPPAGSLEKAVWAGSQIARGQRRASDILLTRSVYRIGSGLVCRVRPGSGVGDVPPTGVAPFPRLRGRVVPPYALRLLWRIMLRGSGSKVSRNHGGGSVAIPGARAAQAALNGWRLPVEPFEERAPNDQPDTGRTLIEILDPPQGHFFDRKQNSFLTLRA